MSATDASDARSATLAAAEQARRARREDEARSATGPLALAEAVFITPGDSDIRIADIPGVLSFDGENVTFTPDSAASGLMNHGQPVTGPLTLTDTIEPGGTELTIELPAVDGNLVLITARLARRGGTTAVRVWRTDSDALASFGGIESFNFDPAWTVPGTYRRYGVGEAPKDTYTYAGIDIPYSHEAPGELTFTIDGTAHTIPVYSTTDDGVFVVVTDETRGVEVDQPMRSLTAAVPKQPMQGESVAISVDLNQMRLFPCAFSPHFTCPLPGPSNRVQARIAAGERGVRQLTAPGGESATTQTAEV